MSDLFLYEVRPEQKTQDKQNKQNTAAKMAFFFGNLNYVQVVALPLPDKEGYTFLFKDCISLKIASQSLYLNRYPVIQDAI